MPRRRGGAVGGRCAAVVGLIAAASVPLALDVPAALDRLAAVEVPAAAGPVPSLPGPGAHPARVAGALADLPVAFEANLGQAGPGVAFSARTPGYRLFLTATETVLALRPSPGATGPAAVRLAPLGADPAAPFEGLEPLAATTNHLKGSDPAGWYLGVPTYARVAQRGVWPGIDVLHYGRGGSVEYDMVVAPGADPAAIRFGVTGAADLALEDDGSLRLATPAGTLHQRPPFAYQDGDAGRRPVEAAYVVDGTEVGLRLGAYDPGLPLVVDPVLAYSTYLGGSDFDQGWSIAVDGAGNIFVTGATGSPNFPLAGAADPTQVGNEAYVTKLSATGALVYSTYLGGSGAEVGEGIAVDGSGNAYVTGQTDSADFPLLDAFDSTVVGQDAFVSKLDPAGMLVYSTYLGGAGTDEGRAIAVDGAGNAYVTGRSGSSDFPLLDAFDSTVVGDDAFLTRLGPTGTFAYSTFLGGSGNDDGRGVAVDGAGNAYVTGQTDSADFPLLNAFDSVQAGTEAFVTKVNPAGSLAFSTYLGGSASELARGIAVDGSGNAYVTGQTGSANFPLLGAFDSTLGGTDAFVTKLTATGALAYSSYLGGGSFEEGRGIATDGSGNAYVAGLTNSTDFPLIRAFDSTVAGLEAFVTKLTPTGALAYSSYLGGSSSDEALGVAADAAGSAYVTGITTSANFPLVDAFDSTQVNFEAFFTKIVSENVAPACDITFVGGSPRRVEVTAQDLGSGLGSIAVTTAVNIVTPVTTDPSPWVVGTTAPVKITATKSDQTKPAQVAYVITDGEGNQVSCDPVFLDVAREAGRPATTTVTGVPQAEHLVTVTNGSPGITTLRIEVNGVRFANLHLAGGEEATVDVARAMRPGDTNTFSFTTTGKPGGTAAVMIHE